MKEKTIVVAGTTNKSKLRGIKKAWKHFGNASIKSVKIEGITPLQPKGWKETFLGALARAEEALSIVDNADYGVGVEAGLLPAPFPSGFVEMQVAVILDSRKRVTVGASSGFEIPYSLLSPVIKGEELGMIASRRLSRPQIKERVGIIGVLTKGVITRTDLTYQAVLSALIPRIHPKLYGMLVHVENYKRILNETFF